MSCLFVCSTGLVNVIYRITTTYTLSQNTTILHYQQMYPKNETRPIWRYIHCCTIWGKKHADMQLRHAPCSYTNQISIPFQSATYTNPIRNRAGGIPRNWPGSTKAASGSSGAGRSHPVTSDGLRYCAAGGFRGRATGPSRWRTGAEDKKGTAAAVAKP
jgi:hypothetical protein